jgi:DivIVA domain-containing protein
MTETDRRQRLITSTPHLSPEEVASRSFPTGFRGYSEAEVRGFLKRVSEQLAADRERERELEGAVDALEEQLREPRPLNEKELLDALGEETARLLRSAREASENIRKKSEERAAQTMDEATTTSERMRTEAEEVLTVRTQEAEQRVTEIMETAQTRAKELCDAATVESEAMVEAARAQGREMLDEAKAARERVLVDLVRRRALLNAQIEVLRRGRDRLLDAYRNVKRTFLEATEALSDVEARAATERSTTAAEPLDIAAEVAAEIAALDTDGSPAIETPEIEGPEADLDVDGAGTGRRADDDENDDRTTGALADVDSLFARLRSNHDAPAGATTTQTATPAGQTEPELAPHVAEQAPDDEEPRVTASEWREVRARTVDPLLGPLLKRAKRVAQDDQNALLDAVRRHKGRPTAAQVLPDMEALLASWGSVLRDAVDQAYAAGSEAAGTEGREADDGLLREAADSLVTPLRLRLTVAIDSGEAGDTGGLVERIGARYREWKNQSLESALAEVLALAWSRGVYDAVPEGAVLWWVPFEEGRCSDCDDNGLEPTVKGKDFPTGQSSPPAHPGCRCLLAPAEILNARTATT